MTSCGPCTYIDGMIYALPPSPRHRPSADRGRAVTPEELSGGIVHPADLVRTRRTGTPRPTRWRGRLHRGDQRSAGRQCPDLGSGRHGVRSTPSSTSEVKNDSNIGTAIHLAVLRLHGAQTPQQCASVQQSPGPRRARVRHQPGGHQQGALRRLGQPGLPTVPRTRRVTTRRWATSTSTNRRRPKPCWRRPGSPRRDLQSGLSRRVTRLPTAGHHHAERAGPGRLQRHHPVIPGPTSYRRLHQQGRQRPPERGLTNGPDISNNFETEYEPTGLRGPVPGY